MKGCFERLAYLAVFAVCISAAVADVTFNWTTNGVEEQLVIPGDLLLKSPEAEPENGKLPISFAQAETMAVSTAAGLTIEDLQELQLMHRTVNGQRRWYYLATFESREVNERHIVVLMDGTVIPGQIQEPAKPNPKERK